MSKGEDRYKVVIVGGGFGGLWAARSLRRAPVSVTLIDKRNFHLFQPLLYQVATGGLSPADIASPLRGILARQKNVNVRIGEMIGIDYDHRQVILKDGRLPYDSLIVATGSENHYYGHDQWKPFGPGLKTVEDALEIRRRIYWAFELAENETDPEKRNRLLTFVIVGGGPTGIELAGAMGEIAQITLKDNFRSINAADARILVIEGGPRILTAFPEKLAEAAVKSLKKLGVEVRTGVFVDEIDQSGVDVREGDKSYRIESRTVLWAAGVKPSPIGRVLVDQTQLDRAGEVMVGTDLSLAGHEDVFVIGDLAHCRDKSGQPLPGTAPVAMSQGRYVADLIRKRIDGKQIKPYRYHNRGNMAVIGRAAAIADLGWARISGYPAWLLWLFIHLMYLVQFDSRLLVFIQWAWNYFTRNRSARLITYDSDYHSHSGPDSR